MARTLDEVKGRCRIEGDCWIWTGATSEGWPRIYAPDLTDGTMKAQPGKRAVWMLRYGKAIPKGWRVFSNCTDPLCVNPAHVTCEPPAQRGRKVAASGAWKGNVKRILANRATGRKRSTRSPEMVAAVKASTKNGKETAAELGVPHQWVSRVRRGAPTAFDPVGGVFSALLVANDGGRRRA